jgi:hypothetical protein
MMSAMVSVFSMAMISGSAAVSQGGMAKFLYQFTIARAASQNGGRKHSLHLLRCGPAWLTGAHCICKADLAGCCAEGDARCGSF